MAGEWHSEEIAVYVMSSVIGLTNLVLRRRGHANLSWEVSDSQCAMNVHSLTHSHQEMLKSKSLMGGTSAQCAMQCAKQMGGEFVLAAGKEV